MKLEKPLKAVLREISLEITEMEVLEGEKLFSNEGGEDKGEVWTDPSHFHSKLERNINLLLLTRRNQKTLTINAEDLNAKHTEWNCKVTNTRSRILTRFVEKKPY